MNSRTRELASFFKQLVSSLLSVVMLVNLVTPAFAQQLSSRRGAMLAERSISDVQKRLEKSYTESLKKTFVSESTNTDTPAKVQYRKLQEEYFADPVIQQLLTLKDAFMPMDDSLNPSAGGEDKFRQHFFTAYNNEIDQQARAARQNLRVAAEQQRAYIEEQVRQAREANVSEGTVQAWMETENTRIKQAVAVANAKIQSWQTQSRSEADKHYQQVLKEVEKESHAIIASKVAELMALYKQYPQKTRPYLLDIALSILMTEGRNTDLFSEEEKQILHDLYLQTVEGGVDTSSIRNGRSYSTVLGAVSALGILGGGTADAGAISEFVSKNLQTPLAPSALLTGVSSLLAMENYGSIRGILDDATRREYNLSYILSFTELVEALTNINGQYLGDISKWAQFPVPEDGKVSALGEAPSGNAWEEVAHMLAAEGSPQALALLRDYGINTCVARPKLNFKDEWDIGCSGIKPFLVGAITSGKSGTYTGPVQMDLREGYVQDNNGTRYISAEQAAVNTRMHNQTVRNVQDFVAARGVSLPASIARGYYLSSMGDLDADSQLLLDTKLFAFFNQETNGQKNIAADLRLKPYTKDSAEYKAKQMRQHRAQQWRTIATLADIAFIVWCSYDIIRLGMKVVNLGRTLYLTTRMARAGAPVASRVAVMYRLKTARMLAGWQRARKSASFIVRNQASQFTRLEPLLKAAPGTANAPEFLNVALSTAKRLPRDGKIVLDAAAVTKEMKSRGVVVDAADLVSSMKKSGIKLEEPEIARIMKKGPDFMSATADLQKSLNQAVERANSGFSGRKGWWSKVTGDRDFIYRRYLSKEISGQSLGLYRQGDRGRLVDFARAAGSDRSVGVPLRVKELRSTPMFDKQGTLNTDVVRSVLDVLVDGTTSQTRAEIRHALAAAQERTGIDYVNRGWYSRWKNTLLMRNKELYNDLLAGNIVRLTENGDILSSVSPLQKEKMLGLLASSIRSNHNISIPSDIGKYVGRQLPGPKPAFKNMPGFLHTPAGEVTPMLGINFRVEKSVKGVKGVEPGRYQRMVFEKKGGRYDLEISDGISAPERAKNIKAVVPAREMPVLLRGALEADLQTPLMLKLTPYRGARDFRRAVAIAGDVVEEGAPKLKGNLLSNLWAARRKKENIWIHELPVYLRAADGTEVTVPVKIMADNRLGLEGARFILGGDNELRLLNGSQVINPKLYKFGLPKHQFAPLMELASKKAFAAPLTLIVQSSGSKIWPLYLATGLSLSSASVGLIAPLETTYRDRITDTHKTWISLAFPYLPSLFAPALAPVVMRFGALRVVQAALGTVAVGLTVPWIAGFKGNLNESKLPPLWPLFVSGAGIGVSSALSRSGLNILIDTMGGGGKLLKSMMFKNAGSLVLLLPGWGYTWLKLRAAPKIKGETLPEATLAKPAADFSLAFPVLTVATVSVLSLVSLARISPLIGRSAAVQAGRNMRFWSEMGRSWKTMFAPEVWPLATSAFFFTGFEAAAFSKASSQAFRPFYENRDFVKNGVPGNRKNTVSLLTGVSVAALPFTARYLAPKLLKNFAKPLQPAYEYKKMLWLSYGMNAAGGLMLMKYGMDENPQMWQMLAGIGLMGLGTANVTQSLQKLANIKVGSGPTIARMVKGMSPLQATQRATELKNITMTGFSWSQVGLAMIPLIQSGYVDREVSRDIVTSSKGPLSSIWIPLTSLGASFGFAAHSIGLRAHMPPRGLLSGAKLLVDGPASFNPMPYVSTALGDFRSARYSGLEVGIRRYLKHEQDKKEVEAAREKARQEREKVLLEQGSGPLPLTAPSFLTVPQLKLPVFLEGSAAGR